jgi:superfamily I DNA/RNA helicase
MPAFDPSPFQQDVFDAVEYGKESLLIEAVAGSGKTTTIVEAVNLIKPGMKVLFLAFNKRIVEELKLRLPHAVHCATFNSQGYKAWRKYVGRFVQTNGSKTWKIMKDLLCDEDIEKYGSFVRRMVSLAKSAGIGGPLLEDDYENWEALRNHHNVYIQVEGADYLYGITLAQMVLRESIKMSRSLVDFDDQIYMPYLNNARFDKYDLVFSDEAQDTNEVQVELLKRMLKRGGRLVAVGDSGQAIYGFRGADHNAMNNIQKAFNCRRLPLSISYRCSKAIVRKAQEYVPAIEPFEHANEGYVGDIEEYNATDFKPTDAILCRNNAPLVKMAYSFIRRGIGINMPGRDLGAGLINFIRKLKGSDADEVIERAHDWLDKEREKLIEKGQEDKIESLIDKVECLEVIVENLDYDDRSTNALIEEIEYLFQESDSPAVTLCSVHKSKGDEWDRVFILDFYDLMPSKYARKEWQQLQEKNLIYVAITRAKSFLGFIRSGTFADEDAELQKEMRAAFREERKKRQSSGYKSRSRNTSTRKRPQKPKAARVKQPTAPKKRGGVAGGIKLSFN